MAGNNGLSFNGLTYRTETTTFTTMSNGGPEQLFYFLLTPENGWSIFVFAVGIIFVNRVRSFFNIYFSLKFKQFSLDKLSFSDQKALRFFFFFCDENVLLYV